jgi:hypothetical protein
LRVLAPDENSRITPTKVRDPFICALKANIFILWVNPTASIKQGFDCGKCASFDATGQQKIILTGKWLAQESTKLWFFVEQFERGAGKVFVRVKKLFYSTASQKAQQLLVLKH